MNAGGRLAWWGVRSVAGPLRRLTGAVRAFVRAARMVRPANG